jgi:hypothetical protein
MRREPEFFEDKELVLVYMARRLKDALAVEELLNEASVDYALETGPYLSGLLFRTTKTGVFFYVLPDKEEHARSVLEKTGRTSI